MTLNKKRSWNIKLKISLKNSKKSNFKFCYFNPLTSNRFYSTERFIINKKIIKKW